MKWMLIIMVFGTSPIKTDLLFDKLEDCIRTIGELRAETDEGFRIWSDWAQEQGLGMESRREMMRTMGMESPATCIPHADRQQESP